MNCLIADDHEIARSTVSHLLQIEQSLKLIGVCEDATEAYRNLAANKIDLLLLDIEMPGISGIEHLSNLFLDNKHDNFVFIRDVGLIRRLKLDEINYLEAQGDYVKIYHNEKIFAIHSSLKSIEEKLPGKIFIRVHRSFIVNISRIDTVEGNTLIIHKSFVPISDAYKTILNKRMQIL
ncbi:DNA-binding response regulator [Pedobacter sp. KBW01]|uniref:LytR/AlgR family response regulator transcription factor n=1 Tax=Pedobacter sp. KBW01 TaxID=2153364 RepID=UPI000F5B4E61|nr:LytTR family DNA-binding domain-containing protein [Pedobacter sp. KBW01]RQO73726.1 DNA-binding response regulator [Pedobacter sp. KBW01]